MKLKDNIDKAVGYLISIGEIGASSSRKDVAERMKSPKSNVSAALTGNEKYLTDGFIDRFDKAFGGIFNASWLLTGEGEMLNKPEGATVSMVMEPQSPYEAMEGYTLKQLLNDYASGADLSAVIHGDHS